MSTRCSMKYRERTEDAPGFHLYEDCLETGFRLDGDPEPRVYLELDGLDGVDVHANLDGPCVTLSIPREMARVLGLLPS